MTPLQEIEILLTRLTPADKVRVLQVVTRELAGEFPGITTDPNVCGGEPCIIRTRIPVWVLEQLRRLGVADEIILGSYPRLRPDDLANAWAYVANNLAEIDQQIKDNEAA